MLPRQFLKTKLLPPRLGRKILARPRLLERMYSYLESPATIVSANAGCGKTTLVADFIHSQRLPSVWYQIDISDGDLDIFFAYLVYGLQRPYPGFGEAILALLVTAEEPSSKADRLADLFVNEVEERVEEKTILVMDDFHHVDKSSSITKAVDRLVRYLPDVLHIIVTSRTMPGLSIAELRSKGLVEMVDRRDLLFMPQEIDQLFATTFHSPLPNELINQIHKKTEGWITALHLIQQSFERHRQDNQEVGDNTLAVNVLRQSEIDLFEYFVEEVIKCEPPETRLTLARLALLERLTPEIVASVFPENGQREMLRALCNQIAFIAPVYELSNEEEYRLHPLFRSFLKRWLATELGRDKIRELHKRCGDYFSKVSQWDLALHHYAEAEAAIEIADLLALRGPDLFALGRFEIVKDAFCGIHDDLLAGREKALIVRADVASLEGDSSLAISLYQRAARQARESCDRMVEADALRGQAHIARHTGDFDRAIELASTAIKLAPELQSLLARCFNIIGLCRFKATHGVKGDSSSAIESWRSALDHARRAGDDHFTRIVLHNLGLPYSMEGDLDEAIHWISQMLSGSFDASNNKQSAGPAPFPQEAIAHLNLARLKLAKGLLDDSKTHLEIALQKCRLFNLRSLAAETLETFGNLYREYGDYAQSLEFYGEAERAYRECGMALTDRELLDERATLYLRMGQIGMADREIERYYEARKNGSAHERVLALNTRGRIQMAAGQSADAETSLVEAVELAHANQLKYLEMRCTLPLARLYWEMGRTEDAYAVLARAVELSSRYDYSYLLRSEAIHSPALVQAAIRQGIAADYLSRIFPEEGPTNGTTPALGPERTQGTAETPLAVIIDRPSFDLTIRLLGPIEVYRGQPVSMPDDAWRLLKSLHILCYLASRRNHRATKEALVEAFWPEADTDAVAKNFHPMISHARKALNHGQVIKKDFILYCEGAYFLNPQYRYRIDTEEFEQLLAAAAEARLCGDSDQAIQSITRATGLYRGDFLESLQYQWADEIRTYHRRLYLEALKDLAAHWAQRGEYEQVIRYGQTILQRDPYREDVHCQVMRAYVQSGNRAAAIEQFDKLRRMLRAELGVAPLPTTLATYETLIR